MFYVTLSSHFLELGLQIISELVGYPNFADPDITSEREVVLEEIKKSNDELSRQSSQLLFSTFYKNHPYGRPVIGFENRLRKMSKKQIVDYYHKFYVPSNMSLIVAGDFDTTEIKKHVRRYFGVFSGRQSRQQIPSKPSKIQRPRIVIKKSKFNQSRLHLAWPIPDAAQPEVPALDALAFILGQGEASRLHQSLRIQSPIVRSISAHTYFQKLSGLFLIPVSLDVENLSQLFQQLTVEFEKFNSTPPSKAELSHAIRNIESEEYYGMETVGELARKTAMFDQLTGDHEFHKKIYEESKISESRKYPLRSQKISSSRENSGYGACE